MDRNERIELLNEAQEKINDAIGLIRQAVDGTPLSSSCEAYIIGHLEGWSEGTNPYDSTAIPRLIEDIENGEDEDESENLDDEDDGDTIPDDVREDLEKRYNGQ